MTISPMNDAITVLVVALAILVLGAVVVFLAASRKAAARRAKQVALVRLAHEAADLPPVCICGRGDDYPPENHARECPVLVASGRVGALERMKLPDGPAPTSYPTVHYRRGEPPSGGDS